MEEQRQATEDDHQNKSDQGHLLNLTKANPAIDKHNRRGDDQRRSSRIDVINLVKREKTTSGKNQETASFYDSVIKCLRLLANQHIQAEQIDEQYGRNQVAQGVRQYGTNFRG